MDGPWKTGDGGKHVALSTHPFFRGERNAEDASVFFRHPISMTLYYGPLTSRRCVFASIKISRSNRRMRSFTRRKGRDDPARGSVG